MNDDISELPELWRELADLYESGDDITDRFGDGSAAGLRWAADELEGLIDE